MTAPAAAGPAVPLEGAAPRVLMVLKRPLGRGGMQIQARRVMSRLAEAGIPVEMVCHARGDDSDPELARWPVPFTALRTPEQWTFNVALYRHLVRSRKTYDLVHVHGFGPETLAAILARGLTGRPLVVKPSTAGPGTKLHEYARWSSRLRGLAQPLWSAVDGWICLSEQTRSDLLRLGVRPERLHGIPNGVDLRTFHPLGTREREAMRTELGLAPSTVLVCSVARLAPHKGADLLVRSFLAAAAGRDARLWLVGEGEQRGELEALARREGAADRVRFLGGVGSRQVRRILQAADLFCLLSRWEGLSNALLEAMACGVPPLVSAASGMPDVVEHGVSGQLVETEETTVTSALAALIDDEDRRCRMGRVASARVRDAFSLDLTVRRLLSLYGTVLGSPAGSGPRTAER